MSRTTQHDNFVIEATLIPGRLQSVIKVFLMERRKTKSFRKNWSRAVTQVVAALSIFFSGVFYSSWCAALPVTGYVYTRGMITNDAGEPYWVEYDFQTGEIIESSSLGAATGERALDKVYQMSGTVFRGYAEVYNNLRIQYEGVAGADVTLMKLSKEEFNNLNFQLIDGTAIQNLGSLIKSTTQFIVVAPPASTLSNAYRYHTSNPTQIILAQMPVDPTDAVSPATRSLLVRYEDGKVIYQSANTIGFRTAFFSRPDEINQSGNFYRSPDDTIWNPVVGARMEWSDSYTGGNGQYMLDLETLACLVASTDTPITAEMLFHSFNPNNDSGIYPYFVTKPVPRPCFNLDFYPVGFGFGLGFWYPGTPQIFPPHFYDIRVDFSVLNGKARLANESISGAQVGQGGHYGEISLGEQTTYTTSDYLPQLGSITDKTSGTSGYDFDRDGEADSVFVGRVETDSATGVTTFNTDKDNIPQAEWSQGVYFSSSEKSPENGDLPDVTRIPDYNVSLKHEGLVSAITEQDLKNTDVYLIRLANGELMAERTGSTLSNADNTYQGVGVQDGEFHYTLHLRGEKQGMYKSTGFSSGSRDDTNQTVSRDAAFSRWQALSGVNPKYHAREADHLRPGESVQIIAINRATGYVGSVITTLDGRDDDDAETPEAYAALLSKMVRTIDMRPPNLKIWAERAYTVGEGLNAGDTRDFLIGNEGAALNSDETVVIYTEWLDQEGRPLPESLGDFGYTGRVARVVGTNSVASLAGNDATFAIKPGRHMEVLQVSNMSVGNDHLYVQVSGEPYSRSPSFASDFTPEEMSLDDKFATSGTHEGRLKWRPNKFVPFLTPVWDEGSTLAQELAHNRAKKQNPDLEIPKPQPVYHWIYRPEFQYSVYDLKVAELNRVEDGEPKNVLTLDTPMITSSDDLLQLIYSLVGSSHNTQDAFSYGDDKNQQLIFALGETEIRATVGSNRQVSFEDLPQLSALDSEDFLSLRLYSNNDARNVLWEFGTLKIALAVDLNRDGRVKFHTKDNSTTDQLSDKTTKSKPFRFWLNDDYDVVNDSGTIIRSDTKCPLREGVQRCEQWDEDASIENNITGENLVRIESERDLEDFAPLAIFIGGSRDSNGFLKMPAGTFLQMTAHGFGINIFKGEWSEGLEYLTDPITTELQASGGAQSMYLFELKPGAAHILTQQEINKIFGQDSVGRLIFEGTHSSIIECATDSESCYLELAVRSNGETVVTEKLFMNILPVKHYYEHHSVGQGELDPLLSASISVHEELSPQYAPVDIFVSQDSQAIELKDEYVMMVHGWRMKYYERVSFAETAFKRLYWAGYKGRFGLFSWPTGWFEKPAHIYGQWQVEYLLGNSQNYGDSEALALLAGPKLANKIATLSTSKNVHVFAHSMGNVVVSEALRNSDEVIVENYIASQAAVVASSYNPLQPFLRHLIFDDPESAWRFYNQNGLDTEYDMPPNHYSYSIPALHGPTSPRLEVLTAAQEGWGPSYYSGIKESARRFINFYNHQDAALAGWEVNQMSKPDYSDGPTWDYEFQWDCPYSDSQCAIDLYPDFEDGEKVTDVYSRDGVALNWAPEKPLSIDSASIISHVVPTRTNALGQVAGQGATSVVDKGVDLNSPVYGYNDSNQGHSAQYYSTYAARKNYWFNILIEMGLILEMAN